MDLFYVFERFHFNLKFSFNVTDNMVKATHFLTGKYLPALNFGSEKRELFCTIVIYDMGFVIMRL